MTNQIKNFQEKLNQELDRLELGNRPKELYEPLRYTLDLGGKRMRPILALMSYLSVKDDWETIVRPALSIELFHNFTLIHDDIMDEAPLRRGKPTVYQKWNKDIGILSGDALMILAYDLLLEAEYSDFKYLLKIFNRCAIEVCEGQQLDMNFEERGDVHEDEYIEMIRLKTAVLLGYSLEFGALLAGLSKEDAVHFRDFGVNIGIGFQLKDDLLDVYGDADKFGKQVGGDIIANKKTWLLIRALELAEGENKNLLAEWIGKADFEPTEKVEAVKGIYDQLDIQNLAEAKMNEYFDKGFEQLEALSGKELNLEPLKEFTKALIERDH